MNNLVTREANGLRTYNPWRELDEQINRIFADMPSLTGSASGAYAPAVDMRETDSEYLLDVDLPGLQNDDIDITVVEDTLTLQGTRKAEQQNNEGGVHRRERSFGSFRRSFRFPGGVDAEKITARFEHGVLHVRVPKPAEAKPRKIAVSVE